MPASGPIIDARGLTRRFGDLTAVDGVDLEVEAGEVYGFLGPNGAGKSTLLRMLIGLLAPSEGSVTVLGCELPREADRLRAHVGYMTQRFSLYEDLTVAENLEFAGEIFGLDPRTRRRRLEEGLVEHGLAERRHQKPATLSGGWKQRLALAVATLHRPRLLLLDEPTAGVDPENRRSFWEKLFELADGGTTVLVSTHYMDEAIRCHRLCMMLDGRRAAVGSPGELIAALEDRVIEVRADALSHAIDLLRDEPRVASVTQLGDRLHVLLEPGKPAAREAAPGLARRLAERGAAGASAQPTEATLEDVFVAVGRGARTAPAEAP